MIVNPYETKACIGYASSLLKVKSELEKTLVRFDGVQHVAAASDCEGMLLLPNVDIHIKPFGHPVSVVKTGSKVQTIFSDARTLFSVKETGELVPKTQMIPIIEWMKTRLKLQVYWSSSEFNFIQTALDYPMMLYGKVFSEALARKYGLDPQAIARIDFLFCYAFWCFSHTEDQFNNAIIVDDTKAEIARFISSAIRSRTEDILSVITDLNYFYSIDDLVKALNDEQITGTKRTSSVTVASLFEVARVSWHLDAGAPASEIAACSLEHTPTWMANVFASIITTYSKGHIMQVAQRYKRIMDPNRFADTMIHLLRND